jgi:histone H3/H4
MSTYEDRLDESAANILIPVMESAMILASHYAKACGRDTVTGKDVSYGLKYAVRNVTGRQIGSLFPEVYESDDEEEEDELEEVDEEEEPFTRYEGDEEIFVNMNRCADTWDSWVPTSPIERMLKDAADKANESV